MILLNAPNDFRWFPEIPFYHFYFYLFFACVCAYVWQACITYLQRPGQVQVSFLILETVALIGLGLVHLARLAVERTSGV